MTLYRSGYELEVDDRFAGPELDDRLWLRHYLPHWSSREASRARYEVGGGELRLRIDADQPPWNPDHDGCCASSLQTGEFAGPLASGIGQLQFAQGLTVREEQPAQALYTPRFGLFEVRLRAIADPANMVALWMIGFEDAPERSGEILVCEIFGRDMTGTTARVAMGVRRWADPAPGGRRRAGPPRDRCPRTALVRSPVAARPCRLLRRRAADQERRAGADVPDAVHAQPL